jgi:hypothetical protein
MKRKDGKHQMERWSVGALERENLQVECGIAMVICFHFRMQLVKSQRKNKQK